MKPSYTQASTISQFEATIVSNLARLCVYYCRGETIHGGNLHGYAT